MKYDPSNKEDFCITVDGDEIQCNHDFQCSDCGAYNDGDSPVIVKGSAVRVCAACGHEFRVHTFTEEE